MQSIYNLLCLKVHPVVCEDTLPIWRTINQYVSIYLSNKESHPKKHKLYLYCFSCSGNKKIYVVELRNNIQ